METPFELHWGEDGVELALPLEMVVPQTRHGVLMATLDLPLEKARRLRQQLDEAIVAAERLIGHGAVS